VEALTDGNKGEVEHSPDNVEAPMQRLNARRCHFDDHKVKDPVS
jgi:hypothetical protein